MSSLGSPSTGRRLLPANPVVIACETRVVNVSGDSLSLNDVGQKAFGLASLPGAWTAPFFCVSEGLYRRYCSASDGKTALVRQWVPCIMEAAQSVGILTEEEVLVRSSGCGEGMAKRGKFCTAMGVLGRVELALLECLEKLFADRELQRESIPLLVQRRCRPEKAKGHLSNERRCYEEGRDWMGEMESSDPRHSWTFQINIRHWRERLP